MPLEVTCETQKIAENRYAGASYSLVGNLGTAGAPVPVQETAHLVTSHESLMYRVIRNIGLTPNHHQWDIAVEAAYFGLFMAARKYVPTRGSFFAYATYLIRYAVLGELLACRSIVKMGTSQASRRAYYALLKHGRGRFPELSPDATLEEISDHISIKSQIVATMKRRMLEGDASLDEHLSFDNDQTLQDVIASDQPTPEEALTPGHAMANHLYNEFIHLLDERERYIVENHIMPDKEDKMTLETIGTKFGIGRERTRQLEARALNKLRIAIQKKYPDLRD